MLWAIDVGNTHTVVGLHDGDTWKHVWRLETYNCGTEDELAAVLQSLCSLADCDFSAHGMMVASVVPALDTHLEHFANKWLKCPVKFLRAGDQVGLNVDYNPPHAVGADRIANALAALDQYEGPIVVADFGTATTFDTIDKDGTYVGGAIMPGLELSAASLTSNTAKLPSVALVPPERAVGKTVVESLQAGLLLGYAGAVDALCKRIRSELEGEVTFLTTGGLGKIFIDQCEDLEKYDPNLTLDGLRIAWLRLNL